MLKYIGQRLQLKIVLVVAFTLLIPTALISVYSDVITTNELLRTADAKNLQYVKSQSANVLQALAEGDRDVLYLSQAPATRRYVGTLSGTSDDMAKTFLASQVKLFLDDNATYQSVYILDRTGQELFGIENANSVLSIVSGDNLENQASQPYFIEALRLAGQPYIADPDLKTTHKKLDFPYVPVERFSLVLYSEDGGLAGVIVLTAHTEAILQAETAQNSDGIGYVFDDDGNYLWNPDATKLYGQILKTGITFKKDQLHDDKIITEQSTGTLFSSQDQPDTLQAFTSILIPNRDNVHWYFVYQQKLSNVFAQIYNARLVIVALATITLLIALVLAWLITRNIVLPVRQLAVAAGSISRGEWDVPIPEVKTADEIGKLTAAFERMSKELKALYSNLEERVIARTSELETVAKVSGTAAALLDMEQLLETVAELTKSSFQLYHTQIYLLDESGENLVLAVSSGEVGKQMLTQQRIIPLNVEKSVAARAARSGQGLVVNDANADSEFLFDALLPNTHSEMAIPLKIADKLLGILDLQSDQIDRFKESELRVMGILGDQIAVAVQNAYLYKHQVESAKQLALAQQKAEQANKAKSLFLSNMSHELRTPLNVVIGYTSSMLDRPTMYNNELLPAIYAKDIQLIKDNGYHLMGLINDILDLSKIEAGKLDLNVKAFDLHDILRGVIATSVGLVKDKPVQINSDFSVHWPLVLADDVRVRQIILNLMSNAVKFTEQGSVTLRVSVEGEFVRISVTDTGIGIPEHALATIFDRFQQAEQDTSRIYGGTGLGLDISKTLVEMQGGTMMFLSTVGAGSTFSFTLPIADSTTRTSAPIESGITSTSQVFSGNPELNVAWTVMVVEDETSHTDLLRRTLESADYMVIATNDSKEAVGMALGVLPDTILLDIHRSNIDVWSVLESLAANPQTAAIPIIVCAIDQEKERAQSLGVRSFLSKPLNANQILEAVKNVRSLQSFSSKGS
jgi:signal transduction histidine kinase/HAMP domain-containing protein/ActR/RegA family two-component response regulator